MRRLHRKNWALVLTVIVGGAALAAIPEAAAAAAGDTCLGGGPLVVNVSADYRNAADFAADHHIWALDSGRESIQIWQTGTDTYCLERQDSGTFTTFAGVSPQGTGTVSAGVTGRWYGKVVVAIQGTSSPTVPMSGYIGDFDPQCQQNGACPGSSFDVASSFFSTIDSLDYLGFEATFAGGPCGVWRQSIDGSTGDIVC